MSLDDDSRNWKRRDKTRRQYRLQNLPYHLDSSVVDDELSAADQERGMGRVLKRIQEGVQGNFDHLSAEVERFAKLYNEGEADSAYMKELLDPHTHPGSAPRQDIVQGGNFYYQSYHGPTWFPAAYFINDATDLVVVPFWAGENMYIDRLSITVDSAGVGNSAVRLGIYNGDNPGHMPGSLLVDGGTVATTTTGQKTVTVSTHLTGGQWYWLAGIHVGNGTEPDVDGYNSTESVGDLNTSSFWWPFLQADPGNFEGIQSYVYLGSSPLPEFLETEDASYSVLAPLIEVRVP